jgi:hypothetical protein
VCFFHIFSSPPTGLVHDVVMVSDAVSVHPRCCAVNVIIGATPQVTGVSVASCVLCVLCAVDFEGALKFYLAEKFCLGHCNVESAYGVKCTCFRPVDPHSQNLLFLRAIDLQGGT